MSNEFAGRAADWLERTYGGLVVLADSDPVVDGDRLALFGCGYADRTATEPMLAASVAVPKDGGQPFPAANADPLDEAVNLARTPGPGAQPWMWRANARNCVVAMDAATDDRPASALPWRPADEAQGWWRRLLGGSLPSATVSTCESWAEVSSAIVEGGPGTRGVVWLRRQRAGVELTGHLLYAWHQAGNAVLLDGQRGTTARLDEPDLAQLVLARFHRDPVASALAGWQAPASSLAAAMDKARQWLDRTWTGQVVLVDPDPADETRRGWLFACTSKRFQNGGDWRDQLLDAALVVPKAAGEAPFGLPNADPWAWLDRWDAGEVDLPEPPSSGASDWFPGIMAELGSVLHTSEHQDWDAALTTVAALPDGARAMIWVRRRDARGRESVGNLLAAVRSGDDFRLIDSTVDNGEPRLEPDVLALHVIRYR